MPKNDAWLFLLTLFLVFAFPVLVQLYLSAEVSENYIEGDIGVEVVATYFAMIFLAPPIIFIAWLALRRYDPDTTLLAWRQDRLVTSAIATILAVPILLLFVYVAIRGVLEDGPTMRFAVAAYFVLAAYWSAALRAAFINRLSFAEDPWS